MTLQKRLIGSRPFASIGASLDINSWDSRLHKIRAELLTDVPCLRELKASVIELQFEPTAQGVILNVYLSESPQHQMRNLTEEDSDLFKQDLVRVKLDQETIEDRISLAIRGEADPVVEPDVARIRKRLRVPRNSNGVTIWTSPKSKTLPLFDLPKVLPLSGESPISVRVTVLSNPWAEIVLCEDLLGPGGIVVRSGTTMILRRRGEHRKMASGTKLANAMDKKSILKVVVAIVLDWDTGEPNSIELIDFFDSPPSQNNPS